LIETCLIMLIGYSSYLLPEILSLSGIISLFSCGIILSHYAFQNMSKTSQKGTVLAFDAVSYLAENFVFIYLGITIVNFQSDNIRIIFTIAMIFSVFLARAFSIFLPPVLYYIVTRKDISLTLKELKVIWYSGLVRGAIAFALCDQVTSDQKGTILSVTLGVVLFTTFALTIYLDDFSKLVGLGESEQDLADIRQFLIRPEEMENGNKIEMQNQFMIKSIIDSGQPEPDKEGIMKREWTKFDKKIMQPTFGRNSSPDKELETKA